MAFRALPWTGDKPTTGLPAAARLARHILLAGAAREAGSRVILMGHTADDVLEAGLMREAGSTTPDPREWAPSPVWPQGRGLFLLRPLLSARRDKIRDWLMARGEAWIDDPANADTTYARPRARTAIAAGAAPVAPADVATAKDLALICRMKRDGGLEIARAALCAANPDAAARFASTACLCAAGTDRPPARGKIDRLLARLADGAPLVATLAGARIEADDASVRFRREPGDAARGGLMPLCLKAGEMGVWDGRFQITAARPVEVKARPGSASPSLTAEDGQAVALAHGRLLAACGAVDQEPV